MVTANPLQQQRLARWLAEWHMDRALRGIPLPDSARPASPPADTAPSVCAPARPGDVRLLFPAHRPDIPDGPLYVAILAAAAPGRHLLCPFSRFAEPATPGEWLTGFPMGPLRVLCLWNTRIVPDWILARSWPAGCLTASQRIAAAEVVEHLRAGTPLKYTRDTDLGPPLLHPADPRWMYEAEAAGELDETLAALSAPVRWAATDGSPAGSAPLARAAEPPPDYTCN